MFKYRYIGTSAAALIHTTPDSTLNVFSKERRDIPTCHLHMPAKHPCVGLLYPVYHGPSPPDREHSHAETFAYFVHGGSSTPRTLPDFHGLGEGTTGQILIPGLPLMDI